jgi:hypothetical protein
MAQADACANKGKWVYIYGYANFEKIDLLKF